MNVQREELLEALRFASVGVDWTGAIEQSNTFIFSNGKLMTFNDEIFTSQPSPLGEITAAVIAKDLQELLERLPDDELEISHKGAELVLKGKRKSAGITCYSKIKIPIDKIQPPDKFKALGEGCLEHLGQASEVTAVDSDVGIFSNIHVTPELIEGCDNYRLLRIAVPTGFSTEVLLPGKAVGKIYKLPLVGVAVTDDWCWFKDDKKASVAKIVGIRCSTEKYNEVDHLLKMKEAKQIKFPKGLAEIIRRASALADNDTSLEINLKAGKLTLTSRKDTGWYRESKSLDYQDEEIAFRINPKFLIQILDKAHTVKLIPGEKIKITTGSIQFLATLPSVEKAEEAEEETQTETEEE